MPAIIKYVEHLSEPGDAVLKSACKLNLEGIISKRASAPYQSGRTESWHKSKCRGGQEVVIGGWSGSANNLRSLLVGVYRGDHLVHTGPRRHRLQSAQCRQPPQEAQRAQDRSQPLRRQGRAAQARPTGTGSNRSWSPRSSSPAGPATATCGRPHSRACARTSPPSEVRAEHAAPARRGALADARAEDARQPHQGRQRPSCMGVVISKPDKPLWPEPDKLHQARPCAISREGRALDDRASEGPSLLHHPRTGRHQRRALLPAP